MKDRIVDQEVLAKHLLTRPLWSSRSKELLALPEGIIRDVRQDLGEFDFDVDLLVCGFDGNRKANIIVIGSTGVAVNLTNEGFGAIGIGWETAAGRLLWQQFLRRKTLDRMMYEVVDAKIHAELIEHVGYGWDMRIITPGRIRTAPYRVEVIIEKLFLATTESPFEKQPKHKPQGWRKALEAYRNKVMAEAAKSLPRGKPRRK